MTSSELAAIVRGIAPVVREFFARSSADFVGRVAVLERSIAAVRDGHDGAPGVLGPSGEPGAAGRDGVDGQDGAHGKDGANGPQGPQGAQGAPGQAGEKGLDGIHGRDGMPGRDGLPGVQGEKGLDGKDGRDGIHGKDGADGLGFDELDAVYDEYGRMSLRFTLGDRVKQYRVPGNVDRGAYKSGESYEQGDGVSYGGGFWIAQQATFDKPGETRAWRLVVKPGRDGKDFGNPHARDRNGLPVVSVGRPK